jgi:hypothetical protein
MRVPPVPVLLVVLVNGVEAGTEVHPWVGFDFEYFGETYRINADDDTVTTINDYGPTVGLSVFDVSRPERRFRLDADARLGNDTRRFRLDFDAKLQGARQGFEIQHQGIYRTFDENSEYLSSDYLQEYLRATYERHFGRARLRVRDRFSLTWYRDPSEYNLTSWTHEPGADLRLRVADLSDVRFGYRVGRRSVPDSTSLNYWRHTAEVGVGILVGWTTSLDVVSQLDRRIYEPGSARESSWENRADAALSFDAGDRTTMRLLHENEIVRFDQPDELYYDFDWFRTGFQVEVHQSRSVDLSLMPLYAFLSSGSATAEEYSETGIEFGLDWRAGSATWIHVSDEIGRREYESAQLAEVDLSGQDFLTALYSDYIYNRVTILVTSEIRRGVAANLFVNWEPENHRVSSHDTDTRIVSGGIQYRF